MVNKGPRDASTFGDTLFGFCSLLPLTPHSNPLQCEWDSSLALLPWAMCHLADAYVVGSLFLLCLHSGMNALAQYFLLLLYLLA